MDTNKGQYEAVNEDCYTKIQSRNDWKPFLRQLLICSGVWTAYFTNGMIIGAPTVFIPQIRREYNSTAAVSEEMASWLSSASSFVAIPCVLLLSILSRIIGRKICFLLISASSFAAFVVFYTSSSVLQIVISQMMQGLFAAAQIVTCVAILTELASPKYRGVFMTVKSATNACGIWASNAIGTFCHWKTIGLVGIVCAAYMTTTVLFWPESPYWLASKGRYKEAAASHRWLKGCDEESEKELSSMINAQKEYKKRCQNAKQSRRESFKKFYTTVISREFYKPVLIAFLTGSLVMFTGKLVITVYAIDIIKKITSKESTAYTGMLILDGITVLSMYVGSVISKFLKRRTMLLGLGSIAAMFLFAISLYIYLIHLFIIKENQYVSICLLMLFSIAVSCGPMILCTSVYGELIPIRSRNLAFCLIGLFGKFEIGVFIKIAPLFFKGFGLHGTFLFFGISSTVIIAVLYKYLPETKDKTLHEISDIIMGIQNTEKNYDADKLMRDTDGKTV